MAILLSKAHLNDQTTVTRTSTYPAADYVPGARLRSRSFLLFSMPDDSVRFQWTGEKRPPRKGEWYLSGALLAAYHANADLSTPYHIARAVKLERFETVTVVPWKKGD